MLLRLVRVSWINLYQMWTRSIKVRVYWRIRWLSNLSIRRFYGVTVSTLDFESSNPSSNLGRTFKPSFFCLFGPFLSSWSIDSSIARPQRAYFFRHSFRQSRYTFGSRLSGSVSIQRVSQLQWTWFFDHLSFYLVSTRSRQQRFMVEWIQI